MERAGWCIYGTMVIVALCGWWLIQPVSTRFDVIENGRRAIKDGQVKVKRGLVKLKEPFEKERMENEIYEAVGFLRNVAATESGGHTGSDIVLQQLIQNGGGLAPVYVRILGLFRLNKKDEAEEYFCQATKGHSSADFVRALIQWDEVEPSALCASLCAYQKSLKEKRGTVRRKRDEIISDVLYLPVVVNILVVFLNFIFFAYFIEQKEQLQNIFM